MTLSQTPPKTKRVLIIDNDEMSRILFRDIFWIHSTTEHPVEVEAVRSIAQARAALCEQQVPFDCIFIGLCLGSGEDGARPMDPQPSLAFIASLRAMSDYTLAHIFVYSKYDEQEYKDKAKEAGADDYIVKGQLTPQEIFDLVEKV